MKIDQNEYRKRYYLVWDAGTEKLLARGTVFQCYRALGMKIPEQFQAVVSKTRLGRMDDYIIDVVRPEDPLAWPCAMCGDFPGVRALCASGLHCGKKCEAWTSWAKRYLAAMDANVVEENL